MIQFFSFLQVMDSLLHFTHVVFVLLSGLLHSSHLALQVPPGSGSALVLALKLNYAAFKLPLFLQILCVWLPWGNWEDWREIRQGAG